MAFPIDQLKSDLNKTIKPVYLLYGEEPQQLTEALDYIHHHVKNQGYSDTIKLFAEGSFDWDTFRSATEVSPLFASRSVVHLRLSAKQPNKDGQNILDRYLQQPASDIIIIISTEKLSKTTFKTSWFKTVKTIGFVQQFKPLTGPQLITWLNTKARQKQLDINQKGINILSSRVEGNMLAAVQEIEKLYIEYGSCSLSASDIEEWVSDQSRFDVFTWVENILEGRLSRSQRILSRIQQDGTPALLVVWAIARELRLLVNLYRNNPRPGPAELQQAGLWGTHKQVVQNALSRLNPDILLHAQVSCHLIDQIVKGARPGNPWICLSELSAMLSITPDQFKSVELRQRIELKRL
ncbi:MAG: DNA polymerase III subunit delta [Gammaproteobacteria bacterium]|nr:DNA polymerase III subunit delta [Gammaproteobacteria bacterium]